MKAPKELEGFPGHIAFTADTRHLHEDYSPIQIFRKAGAL
jgi:hypothetical protein